MEPPSVYSKRALAADEAPDYLSGNNEASASELASKLLVFKRDYGPDVV